MNLTARVVARSVIVLAIVVGGIALSTRELVEVAGRSDVDRHLRDEATQLGKAFADRLPAAVGLDGELSGPEARRAARQALAARPSGERHVALLAVDGTRLQSSGGPPRIAALMRGSDAPAVDPGRIRSDDTDAGPVRILDTSVVADDGSVLATVTIVAPLEPVRDGATTAFRWALLAGAIGIACGALALWLVARRTLRPLRDLSTAAEAISPADLAARVPVPATGDEVAELATRVNGMLERIETADDTRRRYLAAVSHEIRTPLAVAEGHLELLDAPQAAVVRHELDRLRRVLDDLMAVARGSEEVDIRSEAVFLPDLFDAVSARVDALVLGGDVTVEPAPPVVLIGDQARLEQCLTNLVANAVDHNPPGTRVRVSARADDATLALVVADDGSGIPPDILPHVFEPFVSTRPGGRGRTSGLGLAVVRTLAEAHGGRVTIESDGDGTRATIVLPRATA